MSYEGQRIALLTMHGKRDVIARVLEPALGCSVELVTGFDTDQLGTFTRVTPRQGSQLEAARRKARIGMELSGLSLGLASEGSFGPDPYTGMFTWDTEALVFIDAGRELEIVGLASGAAHCHQMQASQWEAALAFAAQLDFPNHGLVLRPQGADDPRVFKDLTDERALQAAFEACRSLADNGNVFLETDLRAHANPTRMKLIGEAARDLLVRLQSACPNCRRPGYAVSRRLSGVPCGLCRHPTRLAMSDIWACTSCGHSETRPHPGPQVADPRHCEHCNP